MTQISLLLMRNVRHLKWLLLLVWLGVGLGALRHGWTLGIGWLPLLAMSVVGVVALTVWAGWRRERLIRERALPQFLKRTLRVQYPHLTSRDADLVERGLRQFFMACNRSRGQFVAMPSKVVDVMWHEFILHTRAYQDWCDLTLGRFLHHTPAEALGRMPQRNDGLRRAWFWACKEESIDPRHPTRLPLLFALDGKLGIAGGFGYLPDCNDVGAKSDRNGDGGTTYCGTSFSDGSSSGDSGNFGGSESSASDSDGGGDGGCGGD